MPCGLMIQPCRCGAAPAARLVLLCSGSCWLRLTALSILPFLFVKRRLLGSVSSAEVASSGCPGVVHESVGSPAELFVSVEVAVIHAAVNYMSTVASL